MNEITIHDVPTEVMKALEADAARMQTSVDEAARQLLVRSVQKAATATPTTAARMELDRIREQIRQSHGTLDVVVPMLREDRVR